MRMAEAPESGDGITGTGGCGDGVPLQQGHGRQHELRLRDVYVTSLLHVCLSCLLGGLPRLLDQSHRQQNTGTVQQQRGLDQPELAVSRRRGVKVLQRGGHITSLRIHETEILLRIAGGELQAMLDAEPSRLEEVSLRRSERSPTDMDETA